MSKPLRNPDNGPWTEAEFFAWGERQEERYEFVDGYPVRLHIGPSMMSGTSMAHERIAVNVTTAFNVQLPDGPCEPFSGGVAVRTSPTKLRRPDAGIACGETDDGDYAVADPRVLVEVFSPSTRRVDTIAKLPEYHALPGLTHILYVESQSVGVLHWQRDASGAWVASLYSDPEDEIVMADVGVTLTVADIYRRVRIEQDARSA